jgi:hypothetical protein
LRGRFRQQRIASARTRRPHALERRGDEPFVIPLDGEREPEGRRQKDFSRARLR